MSKLLVGLLLYAVGIVVFAQSGIGMAPWDVLSDGLSHTLGISLGAAVLGVSVVLLAVNMLERRDFLTDASKARRARR